MDLQHIRRIETPAARNTDPQTSHLAADAITASGERHAQLVQAIHVVEKYPGLTSYELSVRTGLDRYMLARRLPEAVTAGRVVKGGARECTVTRHKATIWWPVDGQARAA